MAGTLVGKSGIWTWFNTPKATKVGTSLYFGSHCGPRIRPVVYRIDTANGNEITSAYIHPAAATEATPDDHDDPALLLLNSDKWLAAWSAHSGANSWCATSTSTDIATFGTPVQITSAGENAYFQLLQNAS